MSAHSGRFYGRWHIPLLASMHAAALLVFTPWPWLIAVVAVAWMQGGLVGYGFGVVVASEPSQTSTEVDDLPADRAASPTAPSVET